MQYMYTGSSHTDCALLVPPPPPGPPVVSPLMSTSHATVVGGGAGGTFLALSGFPSRIAGDAAGTAFDGTITGTLGTSTDCDAVAAALAQIHREQSQHRSDDKTFDGSFTLSYGCLLYTSPSPRDA